ncbi:MAG TPA: sulfurtransferase [Acetobacteraceae bacterium]
MRRLVHSAAPLLLAGAILAFGSLLVRPAHAQPLVSPAWLASHLRDPHVAVLDIRPSAQNRTGHIPGAIPADYEKIGWRAKQADGAGGALPPVDQIAALIGSLGVSDADKAVIVGDDFGAAARVYWTFKVLGHTDVSILDGGAKAWTQSSLPTDAAEVTIHPAVFTAHYDPSLRAELPDVERDLATHDATLVDARPPAQWAGTAKTSAVQGYGHLPGAVWINQSDALSSDGSALKPKAELATLFAKAGDKPVTTYCNTGHLAATDWFVLSEVLHHKQAKLYDGSMSQWTHDPSRPTVVGTASK